MIDIEIPFYDHLKKYGITNLAFKGSKLIIEFTDRKTEIDILGDFDKTIEVIKNKLDNLIEDIKVKEALLFLISRTYYKKYLPACNHNNEYKSEIKIRDRDRAMESLTMTEWQDKLIILLEELEITTESNFPNLWHILEFQMAIKNILHIQNCTLPFAGIILGSPSSMKTLGIELFRNMINTFYSDNFSPKSFVSHSTAVKRQELVNVDLLPKIKEKIFLTPELSPVFSKKEEDLTELLGIWIRVLDGRGYESDSGAQGHRGYTGEFMFVWIGAAVEIPRRVHKLLSTLGPKLYFYRIPRTDRSEDELFEQISGEQYNEKFSKVQVKLQEYFEWFDRYPNEVLVCDENNKESSSNNYQSLVKIQWDQSRDEKKAIRIIIRLAKLLSPLRGIIQTWETKDSQGTEYAYSLPIIEEPDRAITQLRNLSRGYALLRGRNYITIEDIPLIIKVVLSTASIERVTVLDLLLSAEGKLSTSQIVHSLNVSNSTAKRTMTEFKGLGLVDMNEGAYENSEKTINLKHEFSWFLGEEFRQLRNDFTPSKQTISKKDHDNTNTSSVLQEKIPPNITDFAKNESFNVDKDVESKITNEIEEDIVVGNPSDITCVTDRSQLDKDTQKSINIQNMYRLWEGGDRWGCRRCTFQGDRFDLHSHLCKNNKKG